MVKKNILLFNIGRLVLAAFPAISPIADKKFEAKGINSHAWLKADAQVPEVHLILVRVGKKKAQVTCDREKQIVLEWREVG